jgi:hypothetical protein
VYIKYRQRSSKQFAILRVDIAALGHHCFAENAEAVGFCYKARSVINLRLYYFGEDTDTEEHDEKESYIDPYHYFSLYVIGRHFLV